MELNSNQIQKILPHRYPFQMIDKITDYVGGQWAEGIKCVLPMRCIFSAIFRKNMSCPAF